MTRRIVKLGRFGVDETVFQAYGPLEMGNRAGVVTARGPDLTLQHFLGRREHEARQVGREKRLLHRLVREQFTQASEFRLRASV